MVAKADWLRSSVLVILPDAGGVTFPITVKDSPYHRLFLFSYKASNLNAFSKP